MMNPRFPSDKISESRVEGGRQAATDKTKDAGAWLREQVANYKQVYPSYKRYAQLLQQALQEKASEIAPLTIIQTREKSIGSFAEKALRKRDKYSDPANQFTDLCGGRIITRTRSEVEKFCEYIKRNFDIDWENSLDTSQRLKPTEFGYRSIHYIVNFRKDIDYSVRIPEEVFCLKAEVQVRTVVEHAYADFAHDLSYKAAFKLPVSWQRQLAGAAAALEEADQAFTRIEERLSDYAPSYGRYLSETELQQEMQRLEIVLEHDPDNVEFAARLGKLAITQGDWDKAVEVLERYVPEDTPEKSYQPILRDLGVALCKAARGRSDCPEYRKGQRYLEIASALDHADADALSSLAGTWKGIDEAKVREYYRRALEIDPYDPYALGNYLEYELQKNPVIPVTAYPLIKKAIERCQAHVEAEINLPWAFYDTGKFHLLMGEPYKSIDAYSRALSLSSAPFMIETSLTSLERLAAVKGELPAYRWAHFLLLLGLAARFPSEDITNRIVQSATRGAAPIRAPVLIVGGATDPRVEAQMRGYSELLLEALAGFEGTIISGGTLQGISGLVGDAAEAYPDRFQTMGYLPELIPSDAVVDNDRRRYTELRRTNGHGFTPLEPLQNWIDIIASGISPTHVRVLGISGGKIAASEYRIALALGAKVGLVEESGREAGRLLSDAHWSSSGVLLSLPPDPQVVKAFVAWNPPEMPEAACEALARAIHEEYREARKASNKTSDPAMSEWDKLRDSFKESNRDQARHIAENLREIGCSIEEAKKSTGKPVTLGDHEIEKMARAEHGRYVVERLLAGWKWGEERDPDRKLSPYLVGWEELPRDVRELDRQTVRKIPEFLAAVGLAVKRET